MRKILFFIFLLSFPIFCTQAQVNVQTRVITSDVELLWETHSYVPPLYRGKALYPIGGEVTVWALPPTSLGDPSNLTYTWKRNGTVAGALSGVGKRSFTFSGSDFGESPLIVVEVTNGTETLFGALRVTQTSPRIRFYENRPLEGIAFEHALSRTVTTRENTFGVEAYPYFFSSRTRDNINLSYAWSANGQAVPDATGGSISVQSEEPRTIALQLSLNHVQEILQRGTESISITFE